MNWLEQQDFVIRHLSPEVARFVREAFERLERENVFDAPGVISEIVNRMRTADSEMIRKAVARTEALLKQAFLSALVRISV
jgi:hypothetical protein